MLDCVVASAEFVAQTKDLSLASSNLFFQFPHSLPLHIPLDTHAHTHARLQLKFEDLLDDSEASLRVVLTRFGVIPLPWRNEHFWRERKPTDHEWFDLEESHHAHERPHWHKSREYYLQV